VERASVVGGTESDGTGRCAGSVDLYRRVVVGERERAVVVDDNESSMSMSASAAAGRRLTRG
jgi:hypothetical protein